MAGVSSVIIKIGAQTADAVAGIGAVNKALGDTQEKQSKFAGAIQKAAVPAAAALTALAGAAVLSAKAAAEDQASREQLDSQVRRLTGASDEALAANEKWVESASRSAAVSQEELRPALAGLVRTTGDVTKAHQLMSLALDTAAATGKPLATVTSAIAKAYSGNAGALGRLVPSMGALAKSGATATTVLDALNNQVAGAAAGEASTAAGQYQEMQISIHELEIAIGQALLPAMQAILPIATRFAQEMGGHTNLIVALAGAVAGVSAAILVANFAMKAWRVGVLAYRAAVIVARAATVAWSVAQWALNVAMDANPIGAIILAVVALSAAVVIAYQHSATFRSIVHSAFDAVASAARTAWGAISAVAGLIRSLGGLGGALRSGLVGAMNAIAGAIQTVVGWVERLIGAIGRIHFPSIPHIPGLNVAGLGYGGGYAAPAAYGAPMIGARAGATYNITVSGAIDPEATAIAIRQALERYDRRRGRAFRVAGS